MYDLSRISLNVFKMYVTVAKSMETYMQSNYILPSNQLKPTESLFLKSIQNPTKRNKKPFKT